MNDLWLLLRERNIRAGRPDHDYGGSGVLLISLCQWVATPNLGQSSTLDPRSVHKGSGGFLLALLLFFSMELSESLLATEIVYGRQIGVPFSFLFSFFLVMLTINWSFGASQQQLTPPLQHRNRLMQKGEEPGQSILNCFVLFTNVLSLSSSYHSDEEMCPDSPACNELVDKEVKCNGNDRNVKVAITKRKRR